MLFRAIIAGVFAGGLSLGALYGAGEYLDIKLDHRSDQLENPSGGQDPVDNTSSEENGFEGEPHIPLPADAQDDLTGWLAYILSGETAVEVRNRHAEITGPEDGSLVDLGAIAKSIHDQAQSQAQEGQDSTERSQNAICQTSHVMLACRLITVHEISESEDGTGSSEYTEGYFFSVQQDETSRWRLFEGSLNYFVSTS